MKKKIISFLQLCLGIGIIAFLITRMENRDTLIETIRSCGKNWKYIALGFSTFLLGMLMCSLRWKILMDAQNLNLSFCRVIVLFFIGQFFNAFMPGSVGGDVIKAWYVAKETNHKKTEIVATVFIDRIMGMLGLVVLCSAVMFMRLDFFMAHNETRALMVFNLSLLVASIVGLFVVFEKNIMESWTLFRKLEEKTALGKIISRVYNAFRVCVKCRATFFKTLFLSIANHMGLVVASVFLGRALEINIRIIDFFTAIPAINAVAAIPMTPGGLGTREVAAKIFLGTMNVPEHKAVLLSLLIYTSAMIWSIVGGIVYIIYSIHAGKADVRAAVREDSV